jgi:hypothetical protein
MLSIRKQSFCDKRACALYHWIAIAISQIFEDSVRNQFIAPACRSDYLKTKSITGMRQLHRSSRQRGEQHVIADYGDRKWMRGRQTNGGRADVTKVRRPRANSPERRGCWARYIVTLAT